jgi:hypothetical protein
MENKEIKLEDVFNDEKREGVKKFIHEVKSIPKEELSTKLHKGEIADESYPEEFKHKCEVLSKEYIIENRSNAYEFIDFDKQETLEEVAERLLNLNELDSFRDYHYKQDLYNAFIIGIKYQQERSYSEEEVYHILCEHTAFLFAGGKSTLTEWFKQFKKK